MIALRALLKWTAFLEILVSSTLSLGMRIGEESRVPIQLVSGLHCSSLLLTLHVQVGSPTTKDTFLDDDDQIWLFSRSLTLSVCGGRWRNRMWYYSQMLME